jgi:hypothetical protein
MLGWIRKNKLTVSSQRSTCFIISQQQIQYFIMMIKYVDFHNYIIIIVYMSA